MRSLLLSICLPLATLASLVACGDDAPPADPLDGGVDATDPSVVDAAADAAVDADLPVWTDPGGDILIRLRALPSVVSVTEEEGSRNPGYRRFQIVLDQAVDHTQPDGARFTQRLSLLHRDDTAPLVLFTTGYVNWWDDYLDENAVLLDGNQLNVEQRFFPLSRPAGNDWSALTIAQAAADHHEISRIFHLIYGGPWLSTGASKGGMTSVYHRRFYPDDVQATVAYVAPISFGVPDMRYDAHIETLGPPACRAALRALQVELLDNRRAAMIARAQAEDAAEAGITYTATPLEVAVEGAIGGIEWSFWQYAGAEYCGAIPALTASDDTMWQFLSQVSGPSGSSDENSAEFAAYVYQAYFQLGYPGTTDEHLEGKLLYGPEDYGSGLPADIELPTYDATAMEDIDAWVRAEGDGILFIYGQWDPWSGGMFTPGEGRDTVKLIAPEASHSAGITSLVAADQTIALDAIQRWTGVTIDRSRRRAAALTARPQPPVIRVPPTFLRRR